MVSEKMYQLGTKKSTIRMMYEFGLQRKAEIGPENVYDFSIGNPSVPSPDFIRQAITDVLAEVPTCEIHSYTPAPGDPDVREAVAQSINKRFGTDYTGKNLFMTCGAAGALMASFKALCEPEDEFIVFAPYFPEYKCFIESVGGKIVTVPPTVKDLQIDMEAFKKAVTAHTKAVVVNSPNNPSGVVYSAETIKQLTTILQEKETEFGKPIFIISDEPYREIVYDGIELPYIPEYYANTLVCYSYSKTFSLPGERIGYLLVPDSVADFGKVFGAVAGAARVLSHVNAPSLMQYVIARCADKPSDITVYKENGELLYNGFIEAGFECLKPQGAFYLFPKALEADDRAFCERAKKYDLLFVPGSDFGCPGYFRAAYCVNPETIKRAIPLFKKLAVEYSSRD